MGWSVGRDYERRRHIGYGVPATCDHPGCGESIDRGLSYACAGGVTNTNDEGCGLFFCGLHLIYVYSLDEHPVCEQCAKGDDDWEPSFDPTPDTLEWAQHVLTDESWAQWRDEEPEWAEDMRKIVEASA